MLLDVENNPKIILELSKLSKESQMFFPATKNAHIIRLEKLRDLKS